MVPVHLNTLYYSNSNYSHKVPSVHIREDRYTSPFARPAALELAGDASAGTQEYQNGHGVCVNPEPDGFGSRSRMPENRVLVGAHITTVPVRMGYGNRSAA